MSNIFGQVLDEDWILLFMGARSQKKKNAFGCLRDYEQKTSRKNKISWWIEWYDNADDDDNIF